MRGLRKKIAMAIHECGRALARANNSPELVGELCEKYKWGIKYTVADEILTLLKEEIEKALLTQDEKNTVLLEYASEICGSNPIRSWNNDEMIRLIAQAQLDKILDILDTSPKE